MSGASLRPSQWLSRHSLFTALAVERIPGGMDLLGADCADEDILACYGTVTAYKEDGFRHP